MNIKRWIKIKRYRRWYRKGIKKALWIKDHPNFACTLAEDIIPIYPMERPSNTIFYIKPVFKDKEI